MPWVNGLYKYTEGQIKKTLGTLRWKSKHGEWIGENDAEVDCFLACKVLKLEYSYKNLEAILKWLNGERK